MLRHNKKDSVRLNRDKEKFSLNDCLYSRINLNFNIFHFLVNFRLHKICMLIDIEKAFLQISFSKKYRDAIRFLIDAWNRETFDPMEIVTYILKRPLLGLRCSSLLLETTIKKHMAKFKEHNSSDFNILDTCVSLFST